MRDCDDDSLDVTGVSRNPMKGSPLIGVTFCAFSARTATELLRGRARGLARPSTTDEEHERAVSEAI